MRERVSVCVSVCVCVCVRARLTADRLSALFIHSARRGRAGSLNFASPTPPGPPSHPDPVQTTPRGAGLCPTESGKFCVPWIFYTVTFFTPPPDFGTDSTHWADRQNGATRRLNAGYIWRRRKRRRRRRRRNSVEERRERRGGGFWRVSGSTLDFSCFKLTERMPFRSVNQRESMRHLKRTVWEFCVKYTVSRS